MEKQSTKFEAQRARVNVTLRALEDRHFRWMIDALRDHFRGHVERLETSIARHLACSDVPMVVRAYEAHEERSRYELADEARAWIAQYNAILRFVEALSDVVATMSAEAFARDMEVFLKSPRGRS